MVDDAESRPAGPDASSSAARLSMTQRVSAAAATGFAVSAAVAVVAVITVSAVTGAASDARRLSEARVSNDAVAVSLGRLNGSALDPPRRQTIVAEVGSLSAQVESLASPEIGAEDLGRVQDAERAYLATVTDETPRGDNDRYQAVVAQRRSLGEQMAAARNARDDDVGDAQTRGVVAVLVILVVGSLVAAGVVRSLTRALRDSLRAIGRSMRRFGDGDLDSRAPAGDDEIGLVARSFNHLADRTARDVRFLRDRSERAEQLRIISDALDLADDLDGISGVTRRSMSILAPGVPMELMTIASTGRMITEVANPTAVAPACPVDEVNGCVALRRGQTAVFPSSEDLNSCPYLRNRPSGPCSAVCIPVNFGGHLLGVVHSTAPDNEPLGPDDIDRLATMSNAVGARLGAVRQLESTRLEASTDGLTGLANRRMLESSLWRLLREGQSFVLVVADIDRFKRLNDNYGHEAGDRALQLFARVLEANVRDHDIVARFGGEEFVLVYPELSVKQSLEVLERMRQALERAQTESDFGRFTASFGVTHSSVAATPDQIIRVADAGLLRAKELGRNRVVFADIDLAAEVFGAGADGAARSVRSVRSGPATGGHDARAAVTGSRSAPAAVTAAPPPAKRSTTPPPPAPGA